MKNDNDSIYLKPYLTITIIFLELIFIMSYHREFQRQTHFPPQSYLFQDIRNLTACYYEPQFYRQGYFQT